MDDLLAISSEVIDEQKVDVLINRVNQQLSEVSDGLAMVESFSHCVAWDHGDGIACFDASGVHTGAAVVSEIAKWRNKPISHLFYTHGHADHVGGSAAFAAHAQSRSDHKPLVIGHENVPDRIQRYRDTNNWNLLINARQFGGINSDMNLSIGEASAGIEVKDIGKQARRFLPDNTLLPDQTFAEQHSMNLSGVDIELHHSKGETDDHLWCFVPEKKWIMTGDFIIWNFPNAGNPQKVQRYPVDWARALRKMIAQEPELLLPAHGLPITGKARIARVLHEIATALEDLTTDVIRMMNEGHTLNDIIHTVKVPQETIAKPYLRPLYDEPEFVVHNVWRQFGGWWDGEASSLKPSRNTELASAISELAGGPMVLANRALEAMNNGDERLACHLADLAGWAANDDPDVHAIRADIYNRRRKLELSLMAKGIYKAAARDSEAVFKPAQD